MIDNMIMGGKIAMLGVQGNTTTIDWNKVIFNMLTIKGIYGREVFETWHKMTAMLKSGLDISKIVTAEIDYKDFNTGFEMMHSGKSGKVIMNWNK
jgi:threonine 3-dehydrogenase